jgi:ribosomal protein S18 acetylase RimI-like enzyme
MSEIKIRQANETDAALIAFLSRETFYDTFAEHNTPEDMALFMEQQFSTPELMKEVVDSSDLFFLAFYEEEPAGYIKLKPGRHIDLIDTDKAIEISRLYARKSMIGKGVGKAMMLYAIQYAANNQYKTIWLGVWEHNKRAIGFYQSFGFQKFSEHDFILGKDVQRDWLMART